MSTVGAAQYFVQDHVGEGSTGPLDPSNDPFEEDLGYGAKIRVVSVSIICYLERLNRGLVAILRIISC